ncbi:MAG: hypothetical protein IT463_13145 [Planctomycetes bacterium]|nr:hypothetical protein [Planctomycetota bacterium]
MDAGLLIVGVAVALIVLVLVGLVVSAWSTDGSARAVTLRDEAPPICGTELPPNCSSVGQLVRTEYDPDHKAAVAAELAAAAPRPDRKDRITSLVRANASRVQP